MKEPQSDKLHINHIRLSSTQADGDSPHSLRPLDANGHSLSESGLDVSEKKHKVKQNKKNNQSENTHPESNGNTSSFLGPVASGSGFAGMPSASRDNHNHSGASTTKPTATLENAWPRPVVEDSGASSPLPAQKPEARPASSDPTADPPNHDSDESAHGLAGKITAMAHTLVATIKGILLSSWLNFLLVFVPAGIAVGCVSSASPAVVFSLNAIAIVPLAGLLAFATESVARRMGDSIGALLNVTFGNAVELIILYVPIFVILILLLLFHFPANSLSIIALVKNEIRIVQASLLGSILSNLLLILGMGFLLGGLRFREQIYNSTITQMSACLLSLSVISLVLPTAFHASFSNTDTADEESLKISRGTSVVLLLVYGIYLLFQLKSHAYMYESTPQYIIDEEATPGPAAAWLDSSSSDDSSSSSSSSDSDSSGHSRDTMKKRVRRVIRNRRRRKSSVASQDTAEGIFEDPTRTSSVGTATTGNEEHPGNNTPLGGQTLASSQHSLDRNEEAIDEDDASHHRHHKKHHYRRALRHHHKHKKSSPSEFLDADTTTENIILEDVQVATSPRTRVPGETRRVDFALSSTDRNLDADKEPSAYTSYGHGRNHDNDSTAAPSELARLAFNLRAISLRPVAKSLAPTVFMQTTDGSAAAAPTPTGHIPRVRYGIRRTNSLPDRLNDMQFRQPGALPPAHIPASCVHALSGENEKEGGQKTGDIDDDGHIILSRRAAILMLLITTGLVAVCAEFMVDSINGLIESSSVGEVFIGLIILPIVGNAAEHVTAVTVAMKNKMDLAIGVAVGSSIQIALFTTPLVVILGWIMDREMTLYFTLFETVSLFVSAFIVNFLVLDGRSNYLEGALLCATYVIISLVAFYYPDTTETSDLG